MTSNARNQIKVWGGIAGAIAAYVIIVTSATLTHLVGLLLGLFLVYCVIDTIVSWVVRAYRIIKEVRSGQFRSGRW